MIESILSMVIVVINIVTIYLLTTLVVELKKFNDHMMHYRIDVIEAMKGKVIETIFDEKHRTQRDEREKDGRNKKRTTRTKSARTTKDIKGIIGKKNKKP